MKKLTLLLNVIIAILIWGCSSTDEEVSPEGGYPTLIYKFNFDLHDADQALRSNLRELSGEYELDGEGKQTGRIMGTCTYTLEVCTFYYTAPEVEGTAGTFVINSCEGTEIKTELIELYQNGNEIESLLHHCGE
ncbi:hypothetical protein [Flammeovirga agarivorans]|uniref:Lipoprotein n=1 Tax=Flammeovirga agarivorans TaxID=2726742 RepID=A0A7X8SI41_9BACT|nr:hypothetical protein [Flammeovirga agarivorans]NLR90688.1 hypothetical protein [Flammeovirga agarivorans]